MDTTSLTQKFSSLALAAREKSVAAAAVARERSLAAASTLKGRAAELTQDVSVRAKEALDYARRSELFDRIRGGNGSSDTTSRRSAEALGPTIFGLPLMKALKRTRLPAICPNLPTIVFRCVEYVEATCISDVGVYRVSGSVTEVNNLKGLFNIGGDVDLFELNADGNAVCSVLKAFLRELPEPILTAELTPEFQALFPGGEDPFSAPGSPSKATFEGSLASSPQPSAGVTVIPQRTLNQLKQLCAQLPLCNIHLLRFLMAHLDQVQQKAATNKMSISNLTVIFSPTLQVSSTLLRVLIQNWSVLFPASLAVDIVIDRSRDDDGDNENQVTSPNQGSAGGSQSNIETAPLSRVRELEVGALRRSPSPSASSLSPSVATNAPRNTMSVPPPRPPLPKSIAVQQQRRSTGDTGLNIVSPEEKSPSPPPMPRRPFAVTGGVTASADSVVTSATTAKSNSVVPPTTTAKRPAPPKPPPPSAELARSLSRRRAEAAAAGAAASSNPSGNFASRGFVRLKGGDEDEDDDDDDNDNADARDEIGDEKPAAPAAATVKTKRQPPPPPPSRRKSESPIIKPKPL